MGRRYVWLLASCIGAVLMILAAVYCVEPSVFAIGPSRLEPAAQFPQPPEGHKYGRICFTPDGGQVIGYGLKHIIEGGQIARHGFVDFWNFEKLELAQTIPHPTWVTAAVLSSDGKKLITCGYRDKVRIFGGPKWEREHEFDQDSVNGVVKTMVMLPDGKRVVTAGFANSYLRIRDVGQDRPSRLVEQKVSVSDMAVASDGKRLAIAYDGADAGGERAEIWDTGKLEVIGKVPAGSISVALSPNGKWLATGSLDARLALWDAATFKKHKDLVGAYYEPRAIGFTNDSKFLVGCMREDPEVPEERPAKVCIWTTESGKLVHQFTTSKNACAQFALSPDDRWLVIVGGDERLRVWDFQKIRREFEK